jgi:hypothetical protein
MCCCPCPGSFLSTTILVPEVHFSDKCTDNQCTYIDYLTFLQAGGGCIIRLSEPLLKFRPPEDLKETLLHEMIHAKIFLTSTVRDHDDHGPQFQVSLTLTDTALRARS